MPRDVKAYLLKKKSEAVGEEIAKLWSEIDELYSKRLWHQLTLKLESFIHHQCFKQGALFEMYEGFIADFEHKINPLSLVNIAIVVSKEFTDPEDAISFLKTFMGKVKNECDATILCMTALGSIQLQQNQLDDVKTMIEESRKLLESMNGVTTVHANFFDLSSSYNKAKSNYEGYYKDALRYLGCVDVVSIPALEKSERAFHISLAALLAETVYNFGEILSHPVMDSLRGTESTWIVKLLQAFNTGDLDQFEALRPFWEQQPDLFKNQPMLLTKIRLLSVMELVFRRHAHDREISFSTIACGAKIDITEVEQLVMKALSIGLVKGSIDEVLQQATMTWVQPRVLDRQQTTTLQSRIAEWCGGISDTVHLMESEIPDVALHL